MIEELDDDNTMAPDKTDAIIDTYPAKINFSRSTPTIYEIYRQYTTRGTLNLSPPFQREKVWSKKQKSELIESILMGIPLPIMYFFQNIDGNIQVVDGKQRLSSLFEFLENEGKGFKLSELTILNTLKGRNFNELEAFQKANIEDYELVINIIKPPTPDRIKFDIFDRVNRGGTRLNNQEMRNAIYQGKATELLNELSKNEWFQKAIDSSISDTFMKDKYIILRAIAFILYKNRQYTEKYNSDIDEFLGKFMLYLNNLDNQKIESIKNNFIYTMKRAYEILGHDGFRTSTYLNKDRKSPISMAVFEIFSYMMSFDVVELDRKKTKDLIVEMFRNDEFTNSITTPVDSSVKVQKRLEFIDSILEDLK